MKAAVLPERADNPSSLRHRVPLAVLALVGGGVASYLALYQIGAIGRVWDPVFGSASSEAVLTSAISRALPIPDAALGAAVYLLDAILAMAGDETRWQTAPWLVLCFGFIAAGLVLAGMALVLSQLVLVHAGCALCLASAGISFTNGWLAKDEVIAATQPLRLKTK